MSVANANCLYQPSHKEVTELKIVQPSAAFNFECPDCKGDCQYVFVSAVPVTDVEMFPYMEIPILEISCIREQNYIHYSGKQPYKQYAVKERWRCNKQYADISNRKQNYIHYSV
jgi:hypothetical protein